MNSMRNWFLGGLLGSCFALAGACVVGDSTAPNVQSDAPAADGPVGDGPIGDAPPDGANVACEPAQTPINGQHNAGQNCQVAGCHLVGNLGSGAPAFYVSGTLYNNAAGAAPISGGTIVVVAGGGAPIKLATAANGNFYYETPITPPFTVKASKCPDETPMIAAANTGACNSCHQVGNAGRIHLP